MNEQTAKKIISRFKHVCECQDFYGVRCGKVLTDEEFEQDGMCSYCADNVWEEMKSGTKWRVKHFKTNQKTNSNGNNI